MRFHHTWRIRHAAAERIYRASVPNLHRHELAFFAWPFELDVPVATAKLAMIPHDLGYLHLLGIPHMTPEAAESQHRLHAAWLERAHPIVSSQFIAGELRSAFSNSRQIPTVIPLSRLSSGDRLPPDVASRILGKLGIDAPYVLVLNNGSVHKNLGQALGAFHYIVKERPSLKLVVAGFNTHEIRGDANTPWYLDRSESAKHVLGLGLRTDDEVTALIQSAVCVLNPSLYEAGNGSGLDAWALGTPVAMSDIPAFREHIETLGVRAELFHPRCCFQIRDALLAILNDPKRAAQDADISRQAMARYDWKIVATRYLETFDELLLAP